MRDQLTLNIEKVLRCCTNRKHKFVCQNNCYSFFTILLKNVSLIFTELEVSGMILQYYFQTIFS